MQNQDQSALRDLKNKSLRFIRLNGADKPKGEVAISNLKAALNITESEYKSVYAMLHNNQLARTNGMNSHISLTELGREAADDLDKPPAPPSAIHIHSEYSIVQVAGPNSTQSATLTIDQSRVAQILDQIENELPVLNLQQTEKDEAKGLIASLRQFALDGLHGAAVRAIGAALAAIIKAGGSALGQVLMGALHISGQ